ncbi:MAG: hypothetical protein ACREME_00115 [Gemmatimonadales bacterium]
MSAASVELPARLAIFGHAPTAVSLRVEPRSATARKARAAIALVACWALVPLVALIPPHVPWALAAFVAGIYLARRNWNGTHVVRSCEGTCPRCETPVRIRPDTLIRLPHAVTCYGCQSELILA